MAKYIWIKAVIWSFAPKQDVTNQLSGHDWVRKLVMVSLIFGCVCLYVAVLVVALNIAFVSTMMNLVTYLQKAMHMGVGSASTNVTNFIGMSCAFALLGGFLSDSYMTRFKTMLIFGPVEFLVLSLSLSLPWTTIMSSLLSKCIFPFLIVKFLGYIDYQHLTWFQNRCQGHVFEPEKGSLSSFSICVGGPLYRVWVFVVINTSFASL